MQKGSASVFFIAAMIVFGVGYLTIKGVDRLHQFTNLTVDTSVGPPPLKVTFNPKFLGVGESYIEFGDGKSGRVTCATWQPNSNICLQMSRVTHTYVNRGTYTAVYRDKEEVIRGSETIIVK